MRDEVKRVRDAARRAAEELTRQLGGSSNARTPAEWERWFGVYTSLNAMQHVIPVAERRRLADRAVELMRQSESRRLADVVVDSSEKGDA